MSLFFFVVIVFNRLLQDLLDAFGEFLARDDTFALGVCNGCQMFAHLVRLVDGAEHWPRFLRNRSEQFEARSCLVRVEGVSTPWLDGMCGSVLPIAVAHGEGRAEFAADGDHSGLDAAGLAVFAVSMVGESIADRQLARFRADAANRGQVCEAGLWRYSRHPNYFFEWLHWWAYVLFGYGSPSWWVTLAGVVLMYLFLTRVTGIPHTERQALASRGDAYRRYQQQTSAFFPLPRSGAPG